MAVARVFATLAPPQNSSHHQPLPSQPTAAPPVRTTTKPLAARRDETIGEGRREDRADDNMTRWRRRPEGPDDGLEAEG